MFSRVAQSSHRVWLSQINRQVILNGSNVRFASTSSSEPAKEASLESDAKYKPTYAPPHIPGIIKEVVDSIDQIKKSEKLEDQLNIRFGEFMPTVDDEKHPQRDLVNFPRPKKLVDTEATHLLIIPDSWFKFFYAKTGVTGPYFFFGGLTTFLISKEWMILEHEMVVGGSIALIVWYATVKFGPQIRNYFEKTIEAEDQAWAKWKEGTAKVLEQYIEEEKKIQDGLKNQGILFDAKRENIRLQQEAEYRRRLMQVHNEVKRKLDYQIATQNATKQFAQQHMVDWIIKNVTKSISGQQEKEALAKCITDLKSLAIKRAGVI